MGRGNRVQENIPQDKKAEPWTPAEGFDWARLDVRSAYFHAIATHRTTFSHNHETENIDVLKRNAVLLLSTRRRTRNVLSCLLFFRVFKLSTPQDHSLECGRKNLQSLKMGGLLSIIPTLQHYLSLLFWFFGGSEGRRAVLCTYRASSL